jgi:hypothetical protein
MYHAVYQHKTCMAASLLIAEAMRHAVIAAPARFLAVLDDIRLFMLMTDAGMEGMIGSIHKDAKSSGTDEVKHHAKLAFDMLNEFRERRLPKLCMEHVIESGAEKLYDSFRENGDQQNLRELMKMDYPECQESERTMHRPLINEDAINARSCLIAAKELDLDQLLLGTTVTLSLVDKGALDMLIETKKHCSMSPLGTISLRDHLQKTKLLSVLGDQCKHNSHSHVIKRYYRRRQHKKTKTSLITEEID